MKKPLPTSYKLLNIFLLESHFKRVNNIDAKGSELETTVDIITEDRVKDNNLFVTLTLVFNLGKNGKNEIESTIKMQGIFECADKAPLPVNEFSKVNAPAIIFPFIREHLATVSMKAGIVPILLPPINFVKYAEKNKK